MFPFAVPDQKDFNWLDNLSFGIGDFAPVFNRVTQGEVTGSATDSDASARENDDTNECDSTSSEGKTEDSKLFSCPEEGCSKSFVRYSALEKHCEYGVHNRSLEKLTLQDRAKLRYAQRLQEGQTTQLSSVSLRGTPHISPLNMGWALKSKPKTTRFTEKQKSYLESKFLEGEKSSKKTNGEVVAKEMRKVRDANNKRLFVVDEFLTPQQISSYFSRFAAKRKQLSESEYQAAENESVL